MNAKILKTQIFHKIKSYLKGHIRSHNVTNMFETKFHYNFLRRTTWYILELVLKDNFCSYFEFEIINIVLVIQINIDIRSKHI